MGTPNFTSINSGNGNLILSNVLSHYSNVVTNPNNSNLLFKIDSIVVNNYTVSNSVNVNLSIHTSSGQFFIATARLTPESSSFMVSKDNFLYLNEGQTLAIKTNSNNVVHAALNYEIIS